ncbi:EF hand domain-containing protein [Planktotalea frisia]|jgi:Ca2+-binding EF-hand superfamily protein|uniref:EF hand n=1 Tax=Planktotalea frisia TaxID=696762 RepID=A0A1L9P1U9_9RHOB|nr:EF-hand domain-containing protein [Planktotalea frisia]OJI95530.1 EF hand [Planktotalea frisia]PZX20501.1 EF hand domain-containing protein [Planktotalea frisia]
MLPRTFSKMFTTSLVVSIGLIVASAATAQSASEQAIANFQMADANSDGALSQAEFTAFIDLNAASKIGQSHRVQELGLYRKAFARLDANSDGAVSAAELQNATSG